jgi:hypothetical protein
MKKYRFHSDAGHGWLQVKKSDLVAFGIDGQISGFSYQHLDNVYLEEDCDASTFLHCLKSYRIPFEIIERTRRMSGGYVSIYKVGDQFAVWYSNDETPDDTYHGHYFGRIAKAVSDYKGRQV